MRRRLQALLGIGLLFLAGSVDARELSVLFIGNSYTFYPGMPENPGLPKMVQKIAESIDPELRLSYSFHTQPGWTVEKHFNDPHSRALMGKRHDKVILQGYSTESLELTPWLIENGWPNVHSFSVFLPKTLALLSKNNSEITLNVHWARNPKNGLLQENHPGLRFPRGTQRAGRKWCGNNPYEYQAMINQSYREHAEGHRVTFAKVGDEWLGLQKAKLVSEDELYVPNDWSHPSELGSFVTALVLVRDSLRLDIRRNGYLPAHLNPKQVETITQYLGGHSKPLSGSRFPIPNSDQ